MNTVIAEHLNMKATLTPDKPLVLLVDDVFAEHPGWYRCKRRGGVVDPEGSRWRLCMRDGLFRLTEWGAGTLREREQVAEACRRGF